MRILLAPILLLVPRALPAQPPTLAEAVDRALLEAKAPQGVVEEWTKAYLAAVEALRARAFLVKPPLAENRWTRALMAAPLAAPERARELTGLLDRIGHDPRRTPGLLEALAALPRIGPEALAPGTAAAAPPPATLAGLEDLLQELHQAWGTTFGPLAAPETVGANLKAITERFIRHIYIHQGLDPKDEAHRRQLSAMAGTLASVAACDQAPLQGAAGRLLAACLDARWRSGLAADLARLPESEGAPGVEGPVHLDKELPFGRLIVGGMGPNRYDCDRIPLLVDLGGDDTYTGRAAGAQGPARPLALVLDLAGNDLYECGNDGLGSGLLGAGVLVDAGGNDAYRGKRRCQGFALGGIGLLADLGGADAFKGEELCQGAAGLGLGLLLDEAGDDAYEGWLYVQGFGLPGGFGALLDRAGADRYHADGHYPSVYGDAGESNAMSQGVAVGFRQIADGGVGVLRDRAGSDRYRCGQFSCGGGYFFGAGLVHDGAGNDEYQVGRYGGAFAAHQAVGLLLDDSGSDRYLARGTATLAGTWDQSLAFLVDLAGDDAYQGHGITLGGATICSLSALFDLGGADTFQVASDSGRTSLGSGGHPQDLEGSTRSLGLFLALGGRDTFDFGRDKEGKPLAATPPRLPGTRLFFEVPLGAEGKIGGMGLFVSEGPREPGR